MSGTFSSINHNGWISEPFQVTRGIKQGCPLSPLIFILGVEIPAIRIRNANATGMEIPSNTNERTFLKIKQLAEDTTLFIYSKEDMQTAYI